MLYEKCGGRQFGTRGSELPEGSGHISSGFTWHCTIIYVCAGVIGSDPVVRGKYGSHPKNVS